MKTYLSKLLAAKKLTSDVFQYDFERPTDMDFVAGQFFMLKVEDGHEKAVNRAYSVASHPGVKDTFSLCIKLIEGGRGSEFLRTMKEGTEVEFMSPFGHFVLSEPAKNNEKDLIMVGTGTGLAPFMGMLPELFKCDCKMPITLYFGVRHETDLFYLDELRKWEEEHDNFTMVLCVSRPEDSWEGFNGRVTEALSESFIDPENSEIYICGNGNMVKDVKAMMLEAGMDKKSIFLEQFTTG